ncbi:unnamed protein product [Calicophoron daubneyi]|uniref:Large ribosomal subunit protein uL18m n=1 Tax=Calicophoron daubneyi TaxID=300641 RepID=A0AAV2TJS9_CALDB
MLAMNMRISVLCQPTRNFANIIYKNRNPRNLELMGLAPKRKGWEFQSPRIDYWHKVCFKKDSKHTTAFIMHSSSFVVTSASTNEPNIRKHLYSCVDVSAAENIGRVLAVRCHRCGIIDLFFDTVETPLTSQSVKAFYNALIEGGLSLTESEEVLPPEPLGVDYDSMTEEEKRSMYPSLIENLRTIPDWSDLPYPYSLRPKAGPRKNRNDHQILSKVRRGMVWDEFYHRMVLPRNKAYWQHELERRRMKELEESSKPSDDNAVETLVPEKWRLE